MTDYMNKFKEVTNAVAIDINPLRDSYERKRRAREASSRFIAAVGNLPENGYLGWEVEVSDTGHIATTAFSSSNVDVVERDFHWIFQERALTLKEDFAPSEKRFWEKRYVYVLSGRKEYPDSDMDDMEMYYDDFDEVCDHTNDFESLLDIMQDFGKVFFWILAVSDGCGGKRGNILVSLPEAIPLRMRTALSIAFPNTCIRRVEKDSRTDAAETFFAAQIEDSMAGMLGALMSVACKNPDVGIRDRHDTIGDADQGRKDHTTDSDVKSGDGEKAECNPMADDTPLEELELSVRAYNCLRRAGVTTVGQLRAMSDEELMKVRNLGKRAMDEVKRVIASVPALTKKVSPASTTYMEALDELIGLAPVKEQVRKIAAYAKMKQDMESAGRAGIPIVLNMEFVGNPGTAKTTVARILAGIFHEAGLLDLPEMVEVGRADLIARYEGQTADKVREVFRTARGKVLFIDEAYSLVEQWEGAYGDEAIDTIVQEMENHRDETIVVFAGYPKEMDEFFSRNPGLRSRVPFRIAFGDYSADEMELISELEAKKRGFTIQEQAKKKVAEICRSSQAVKNAGNGRFCRNLVENAILGYAVRVYGQDKFENKPSNFEWMPAEADEERRGENRVSGDCVLVEEDFSEGLLCDDKKAVGPIGFLAA